MCMSLHLHYSHVSLKYLENKMNAFNNINIILFDVLNP